jgi:putative peptidoglycan lipid II flippase
MTETPRTVRAAAGMGAITAVSRAFGFVRVLVIAAVLGTTYLGNAFQSANAVSNVLFELVAAGALSAVLVPAFVDLLAKGDQPGAEHVAGGVLGVAMSGLGALAAIGMLAAPLLARLLTLGVPPDVADEQQDLVAFLLVFFLPQVVLYSAGTVATGVLHARRRFLAAAAAPIANTLVMVGFLLAFRSATGGSVSLSLTTSERLLLAAAGTGGVLAFTAVLVGACRASGFHLVPRRPRGDARVWGLLRHAGWGVVLHTSAGVLLAGAILAGAAVEGGVVAYNVAWVFFLAPYAIFTQPIHTAILPELVAETRAGDGERYDTSVRWAVERIGLTILPISALMVALAGPGMRLVSFGEAEVGDGPELLAVALASLAVGLFPYGLFLMLSRAFYARNDARTPGLVAIAVAVVGVIILVVGSPFTSGTARLALIGLAHSAASAVGAVALLILLHRRVGSRVLSPVVAAMGLVSLLAGLAAYAVGAAVGSAVDGRLGDLLACGAGGAIGAVMVLGGYRVLGVGRRLTARRGEDPAPVIATASGS